MTKKLKTYHVVVGRPVTVEIEAFNRKDAERRVLRGAGENVYDCDDFVLIGKAYQYSKED